MFLYNVAIWECVLINYNIFTGSSIVIRNFKRIIIKKWSFKSSCDNFEHSLVRQFNIWCKFSPLDFWFQSFNTLCYAPWGKNIILTNSQRLHLWLIGPELNGIILKVYLWNPFILPHPLLYSISAFPNPFASSSLLLLPFCAVRSFPLIPTLSISTWMTVNTLHQLFKNQSALL